MSCVPGGIFCKIEFSSRSENAAVPAHSLPEVRVQAAATQQEPQVPYMSHGLQEDLAAVPVRQLCHHRLRQERTTGKTGTSAICVDLVTP